MNPILPSNEETNQIPLNERNETLIPEVNYSPHKPKHFSDESQTFTKGKAPHSEIKHIRSLIKDSIKKYASVLDIQKELSRSELEGLFDKPDFRKPINENKLKNPPYSCILKLKSKFKQNENSGSAVLVGPYHALTAAHNLYDEKANNEFVEKVILFAFLDGEKKTFDYTLVSYIYQFKGYDLAFLLLREPLGLLTGWFGMKYYLDDEELKELNKSVTGYPEINKCTNPKIMYTQKGFIVGLEPSFIYQNIQTSKGQSGGPIWELNEEGYSVVGIHTHELDKQNYNKGVRITKEFFNKILSLIEEKYFIQDICKTLREFVLQELQADISKELMIKYITKKIRSNLRILIKNQDLAIESGYSSSDRFSMNDKSLENAFQDLSKIVPRPQWKRFSITLYDRESISDNSEIVSEKSGNNSEKIENNSEKSENNSEKNEDISDDSENISDKSIIYLIDFLDAHNFNEQKIEDFELKLYRCANISPEALIKLSERNIFSSLQKLNICFYKCAQIDYMTVKKLINSIAQSSNKLQELTLKFCEHTKPHIGEANKPNMPIETNDSLAFLCINVITSFFRKLVKLHLDFSENTSINNNGFEELSKLFSENFHRLQDLYLDFSYTKNITDSSLKFISDMFKTQSSSSFKKIVLRFSNTNNNITSQNLNVLTKALGSANMKKLEHLQLDFTGLARLEEEIDFDMLSSKIDLMLQYLSLNFNDVDMSFTSLMNALNNGNYQKLQFLVLSFSNCSRIVDADFIKFEDLYRNKLRSLEYIWLNFGKCPITYQDMKFLVGRDRPKFLQFCHFEFSDNSKGMNSSPVNPFDMTKQKKEKSPLEDIIRHLSLNLSSFKEVDKDCLFKISYMIDKNKTVLEYLYLDLSNISTIDYSTFSKFYLKDLIHLNSFSLIFEGCQGITDEVIGGLSKTLNSMNSKNLRHLCLRFTRCDNITAVKLKELQENIVNNFKRLQTLEVSFRGCTKISQKDISVLSSLFGVVKNLKLDL